MLNGIEYFWNWNFENYENICECMPLQRKREREEKKKKKWNSASLERGDPDIKIYQFLISLMQALSYYRSW